MQFKLLGGLKNTNLKCACVCARSETGLKVLATSATQSWIYRSYIQVILFPLLDLCRSLFANLLGGPPRPSRRSRPIGARETPPPVVTRDELIGTRCDEPCVRARGTYDINSMRVSEQRGHQPAAPSEKCITH